LAVLHSLTLSLTMADILNLLTLFEGRETEEADKAWTSDVRS